MQQRVRKLGDREDEDEIEEQLGIGDPAVPIGRDDTKQRAARIFRRHCPASRDCRQPSGTPVLQRKRVQRPAHLALQRLIDDLVLLHARLAAEDSEITVAA